MAEAQEAVHRRAELLVDLDVELVVVVLPPRQVVVVVRRALAGRRRQPVEHLTRERGDRRRRNDAVGVELARQRIADGPPEDALPLGEGGDARERQGPLHLAEPLVVHEEEGAVADDGPAEDAPELVAVERGLHPGGRLEEAGGVERGVAVELPRRAVKRVGAAAERGVDDGAAGTAELGAEVVGLDLELLHGVGRDLHDLVREALVAGAVGVVVHPVEDEVVERAPQAVDVEGAVARVADRRLADAGAEEREIGVGPPVQRQVDDLLPGDDLSAVARLALEQPRRADDLDRLADVADLHRQVDPLAGVDGDRHVLGHRSREALELGLERVGADADVQDLERAVLVGDARGRDPRRLVGERDGRARHGGAGLVGDEAQHGCGVELRQRGARQQGEQRAQEEGKRSNSNLWHGSLGRHPLRLYRAAATATRQSRTICENSRVAHSDCMPTAPCPYGGEANRRPSCPVSRTLAFVIRSVRLQPDPGRLAMRGAPSPRFRGHRSGGSGGPGRST